MSEDLASNRAFESGRADKQRALAWVRGGAPLNADYKDFPASAMVAEMTKEGRTASL